MNDVNSTNEHIKSFLSYYFNLTYPPHYAVLLKGPWGVGKTWFLKKILEELHNPDHDIKRYLYVSLYGVTSFKEIEDEFFRQMYPFLSSDGVAIASKLTASALSFIKIKPPEIELSDYLNKTEELILVFDDLERASIDLVSLLGYINYFVEQKGNKVVILANENEILDSIEEKSSNYIRIKEKLIGKTFEVEGQFYLAAKNFIEEVEPVRLQSYLEENLPLIKDYYDSSNYNNLRYLRQALMDFARLVEEVPDDVINNKKIFSHMLSIFLLLSFEIRSGRILPKDIASFQSLHYGTLLGDKEGVVKDDFYKEFQLKYSGFNYQKILFEPSVWISIFDKGLIPLSKMKDSIYNSEYFKKDDRPDWVKLWNYLELNDEEFDRTIESVMSDFKQRKYEKIGIVKHITGLFLLFSEINLISINKVDILNSSKEYIDDLVKNNILLYDNEEDSFFDRDSWGSLGFHEKNSKEFIELYDYIKYKIEEQKLSQYPDIASEFLEYMEMNVDTFYQKIAKPYEDRRYGSVPILKYIRPEDFIATFLRIHPSSWQTIIRAIKKRYEPINIKALSQEMGWLEKIVILFDVEVDKRSGKLSEYQLSSFIKFTLIPSINNIRNAIIKEMVFIANEPKDFNIKPTGFDIVSIKYR